jgi:hypothetical protein
MKRSGKSRKPWKEKTFNLTACLLRKLDLSCEKLILSSPKVKAPEVLPSGIADMVKQFYVYNEISWIMPGTKDYASAYSQQKGSSPLASDITKNVSFKF